MLIGEPAHAFEAAFLAILNLSRHGLGMIVKDRGLFLRRPFQIRSVAQISPEGNIPLWNGDENTPLKHPSPTPLIPREEAEKLSAFDHRHGSLTVDFISPTIFGLDQAGRHGKQRPIHISANQLAQAAYNRITQLAEIWCNRPPDGERIRFNYNDPAQPQMLKYTKTDFYFKRRKSTQEGNRQPLPGWMGPVIYQGNVGPLHYLLQACQTFGLGQNTTSGFGCYHTSLNRP